MKYLCIFLILLSNSTKSSAQITNIKAGLWSDNTIWSNNSIPVYTDEVIIYFDVTVDINAICKSLNINGHNVTINSGVHLDIVGDSAVEQQLNMGLLAWYPFNGSTADESSNGYDLTVNGAVTTANRFGEMQKAFKFNGISDIMIIPKMLKADSLRELTISAWVKVEDLSHSSIISFLSKDPPSCSSYLGLDNSNMKYSTAHQIITQFSRFSCTTSLIADTIGNPVGQWSHIVLVQRYKLQGSTSYEYSQYYNGRKLKMTSTRYGSTPIATSFSQGGIIGGDNTSGDYNFNSYYLKGDIDDIRIYDRALSDNEVEQLYNLIE